MKNIALPFVATAAVSAVMALSAHANDMKLKYDRPAKFFEEALVIGNGNIGAIVYGDELGER